MIFVLFYSVATKSIVGSMFGCLYPVVLMAVKEDPSVHKMVIFKPGASYQVSRGNFMVM